MARRCSLTNRANIVEGSGAEKLKYGLIYTKKCGWVDLGHATPIGGASVLWKKISTEQEDEPPARAGYFVITYGQKMTKKKWGLKVTAGINKKFEIKKGLDTSQKKSVALAIFLQVSKDFENLQGNWFYKHTTDSGFSAEDLVSNLIGFYRAVEPNRQYLKICEPVSKGEALEIWDKYGAVGNIKNHTTEPYLFPTSGEKGAGPVRAALPKELSTIDPAKEGPLFKEVLVKNVPTSVLEKL